MIDQFSGVNFHQAALFLPQCKRWIDKILQNPKVTVLSNGWLTVDCIHKDGVWQEQLSYSNELEVSSYHNEGVKRVEGGREKTGHRKCLGLNKLIGICVWLESLLIMSEIHPHCSLEQLFEFSLIWLELHDICILCFIHSVDEHLDYL